MRMETISDLKELAKVQNPMVSYFDPLKLSETEFESSPTKLLSVS